MDASLTAPAGPECDYIEIYESDRQICVPYQSTPPGVRRLLEVDGNYLSQAADIGSVCPKLGMVTDGPLWG